MDEEIEDTDFSEDDEFVTLVNATFEPIKMNAAHVLCDCCDQETIDLVVETVPEEGSTPFHNPVLQAVYKIKPAAARLFAERILKALDTDLLETYNGSIEVVLKDWVHNLDEQPEQVEVDPELAAQIP